MAKPLNGTDGSSKTGARMDRRRFLKVCSGGAMAASSMTEPSFAAAIPGTLKAHAARCGVTYGCMVLQKELDAQPDLRAAVVREAAMIVPGIEMKWPVNQPHPRPPNYDAADALVRFATEHDLLVRGHTALWYRSMPEWISQALQGPKGEKLMEERVRSVIGHFNGHVVEWDVVNEAIEPKDGNPGGFRSDPFYRGLGPGYIADAFHIAAEADPNALLLYNDYGNEYVRGDEGRNRRDAMLALLTDLKKQGVPVHGFGIQSHLIAGFPFDEKVFRKFLAEVAALGLRISITEFDVNDYLIKGDQTQRDQQVADHARRFLDVTLDEPAVRTVMTWGLSNRASWLNGFASREDGTDQRPLPLDADMKPNALWHALAQAFDHAPERG